MDDPWLRRDYTGFWRLPEPLPPARWPRVVLAGLLLEVLLLAIGAGLYSETWRYHQPNTVPTIQTTKISTPA